MDTLGTMLQDLTRTEAIALEALLEHIGLPVDEPTPVTSNGRTWTKAQRTAHSKRMKAYWRAKRSG